MSAVTAPVHNSAQPVAPYKTAPTSYVATAETPARLPLVVAPKYFAPEPPAMLTAWRGPGLETLEDAGQTVEKSDDRFAYVVVQLPADAKLFLGGNKTSVSGAVRKFKIPVSDSSKEYSYTIRAELVRHGQTYVAESTESLVAGKTISIKVNDVPVALAAR